MNIVQATQDKNLFKPYLQGSMADLSSWRNWLTCLRVIYGLKLRPSEHQLVRQCTGRDPAKLDLNGYRTALLLCGRRSGKSKVSGLLASYEASLSGRERLLSPGEIPMVTITSPTREQSTIIKSYSRAALGSPMLDAEVGDDVKQGFPLGNGVHVRILTGSFKSVRGFTQVAVIVDEVCFFGYTEESKVKSDTELVRSIRPSLLTTRGKLVCVSTKYAMKGWAYGQWKKYFGNDGGRILVWDATSKLMNPTLSEQDIQDEIDDDPAAASEYLNEWREDVQTYLPREVIESVVVRGRTMLMPRPGVRYFSFCDLSGGRRDSAGLAIAHKVERKIVLDFVREWKPPFNPHSVCGDMATELRRYGLNSVTGDKYAAEFVTNSFKSHDIIYHNSEKNKSELYLELIGPVCSREIELLDNERLVVQLSNLERKTRSGGKDIVDHGPNGHDDLSNVCAGVASVSARPVIYVGTW